MRIVYVVETFTVGLGYIDNVLPRELARLGHEVHVLTCDLPMYYQTNYHFFKNVDGGSGGKGSTEDLDGFTLHWLPYAMIGRRIVIRGLHDRMRELKPDVVVVRGISSYVMGQVILAKIAMGNFRLFTSTGQEYSNIPAELRDGGFLSLPRFKNLATRVIPGKTFSCFVDRCIGSTMDCVDYAVDFYGVPRSKTTVISLGVDTNLFKPVADAATLAARNALRAELGIEEEEVVCIWTGRLTPGKEAGLLALAVEELRASGHPFRGLFIGAGPEEGRIRSFPNSILLPFMPWMNLPPYYRAADVAVWPRSLTTSTLDASACGLPIVLSDQERAVERWEGNGFSYREKDLTSLKETLLRLKDRAYRKELGDAGVKKMREGYSWESIARQFAELFGS